MRIAIVAVLAALCLVAFAAAQNPNELFERGMSKEARGDLNGAVQDFENLIRQVPTSNPLFFRALLQLGHWYELLDQGQLDKARSAYQRVANESRDQAAVVEAKTRLIAIAPPPPPAPPPPAPKPVEPNPFGSPSVEFAANSSAILARAAVYVADIDPAGNQVRSAAALMEPSSYGDIWPTWAPDGTNVLYFRLKASSASGGWSFARRSIADNQTVTLLSGEGTPSRGNQSFLANGDILRTREMRGNQSIETLWIPFDLATGDPKTIVATAGTSVTPAFTVGTDSIYYASSIARNTQIQSIDLATGASKPGFTVPFATESLRAMRLSPNGRVLALIWGSTTTALHLARVGVDGSDYKELVSNMGNESLSWTPDGKALFFGIRNLSDDWKVMRIPVAGGPPVFTGLEVKSLLGLDFSPDGKRVVFSGAAYRVSSPDAVTMGFPNVLSSASALATNAAAAPPSRPAPINSPSAPAASSAANLNLVTLNRNGVEIARTPKALARGVLSVSPNGVLAAVRQQRTVAIFDISTGSDGPVRIDGGPAFWSGDGQNLVYLRPDGGTGTNVYRRPPGSTGIEDLLWESPLPLALFSWSQDGRFILMGIGGPSLAPLQDRFSGIETSNALAVLPLIGERKPVPLLTSPESSKGAPQLSPDSSYISYMSTESGSPQMWVRPFDVDSRQASASKGWQVSSKGASGRARWRADGHELYYLSNEGVMVVRITTTDGFKAAPPERLFPIPPGYDMTAMPGAFYDVAPNGERFYFLLPAPPPRGAAIPARAIAPANAAAQPAIVETLNANLRNLEASLPDIVCKETLTRTQSFRGTVQRSQTTLSTVRAVRQGGTLRQSKDPLFISASAEPPTMQDIVGVLSADLSQAFGAAALSAYNYTLAGTETFRGVPVQVIQIARRDPAPASGKIISGKAWIDPEAAQVVHLDFIFEVPNFQPRTSVTDYSRIEIGGQAFWVLSTLLHTAYGGTANQDMAYEWVAEYSDCRRFDTSIQIKPAP